MSEKFEVIPVSNPINRERKTPKGVLSFNEMRARKKDPLNEAVKVLIMEDQGAPRDQRKAQVLNYFPDNSPEGAKTVEKIVNRTTGFNQRQLSSLLNHVRLKDFRDKDNFVNALDEGINKAWLEDL